MTIDPAWLADLAHRMRSDCSFYESREQAFLRSSLLAYIPEIEHVAGCGSSGPVPGSVELPASGADWTVAQVAERFGRHPSTVRGWCDSGLIRGAYKFRNREWRIPVESLMEFEESQRKMGSDDPHAVLRSPVGRAKLEGPKGSTDEVVDLGSWRREAS